MNAGYLCGLQYFVYFFSVKLKQNRYLLVL